MEELHSLAVGKDTVSAFPASVPAEESSNPTDCLSKQQPHGTANKKGYCPNICDITSRTDEDGSSSSSSSTTSSPSLTACTIATTTIGSGCNSETNTMASISMLQDESFEDAVSSASSLSCCPAPTATVADIGSSSNHPHETSTTTKTYSTVGQHIDDGVPTAILPASKVRMVGQPEELDSAMDSDADETDTDTGNSSNNNNNGGGGGGDDASGLDTSYATAREEEDGGSAVTTPTTTKGKNDAAIPAPVVAVGGHSTTENGTAGLKKSALTNATNNSVDATNSVVDVAKTAPTTVVVDAKIEAPSADAIVKDVAVVNTAAATKTVDQSTPGKVGKLIHFWDLATTEKKESLNDGTAATVATAKTATTTPDHSTHEIAQDENKHDNINVDVSDKHPVNDFVITHTEKELDSTMNMTIIGIANTTTANENTNSRSKESPNKASREGWVDRLRQTFSKREEAPLVHIDALEETEEEVKQNDAEKDDANAFEIRNDLMDEEMGTKVTVVDKEAKDDDSTPTIDKKNDSNLNTSEEESWINRFWWTSTSSDTPDTTHDNKDETCLTNTTNCSTNQAKSLPDADDAPSEDHPDSEAGESGTSPARDAPAKEISIRLRKIRFAVWFVVFLLALAVVVVASVAFRASPEDSLSRSPQSFNSVLELSKSDQLFPFSGDSAIPEGSVGNGGLFGSAVSVSANGSTVAVLYGTSQAYKYRQASIAMTAYVYKLVDLFQCDSDGACTLLAYIKDPRGLDATSISLSGDGTRLGMTQGIRGEGVAALVYAVEETTATLSLVGSSPVAATGTASSSLVALSYTGDIMAQLNLETSGDLEMYFYDDTVDDWKPLGSSITGKANEMEVAVALADSGVTVARGSNTVRSNKADEVKSCAEEGTDGYAVRVHQLTEQDWVQKGLDITGPHNELLKNRESVALSANGAVVVIAVSIVPECSATESDDSAGEIGHVRVLRLNDDNEWISLGDTLVGKEGQFFGESVAINADGTVLAVGANGMVFVYEYDRWEKTWVLTGTEEAGDGENSFGQSLALSSQGSKVVVGAPQDDKRGTHTGSATVISTSLR